MSLTTIESMRLHTTTGSFGGTISGVTVATPFVITCTAAHGLVDGDPIQVTGVGGITGVNTVGYAKITGYSASTFGFYSDAALTSGITGTGSYTSGGKVTQAADVSGIIGDWTIKLNIESLTAAATVLLYIQTSTDGFVNDIQTLGMMNVTGPVVPGASIGNTFRAYNSPFSRMGVTNGRLRLYVENITSAASVVASLFVL